MASVISVLAKLKADTGSYVSGMKAAQKATENFNRVADKEIKKTGDNVKNTMGGIGQSAIKMGTLVKGAVVGFVAIQGAQFLKGAIKQASTFEAEFEGVNQVFGDGAKIVQDYAKNAAATAGIAEATALRFAKSFGGYAKTAGLAGDEMGNFSTGMVQAAGDLGSFFDLPTESALMAIQQGLRGEYEPLRRFNIILDEATIGQKAMGMGISETGKNLTQQQKILVRQKAIMEGLGVAQGDFVKYSDTYGNSIKTTSALFQNLQKDVGAALLPAMAKLSQALVPLIDQLGPLLTQAIAALAPIINIIAQALPTLIPLLKPILDLFARLTPVIAEIFKELLPPLVKILTLLIPVIVKVIEAFLPLIDKLLPPLTKLLNEALIPAFMLLVDYLNFYVIPMIEYFTSIFGDVLGNVISFVADLLKGLVSVFTFVYENVLKPLLGFIMDLLGIKTIDIKVNEAYISSGVGPDALERKSKDSKTGGAGSVVPAPLGGAPGAGDEKPKNSYLEFYKKMTDEIKQQQARVKLAQMGLNSDLIDQIVGLGDGWDKVYQKVVKGGTKAIASLESRFARTASGMAKIAEIVQSSMNSIRDAIINGFDISQMGNSAKQILGNARRMVERAKAFGAEILNLAKMNLNPVLLNQIIAAGPQQGFALAKSLSAAGMPTINELNSLYGQTLDIGAATARDFATAQTNYYIDVSGGLGDKNTIGKSIVEAVKSYERQNGKVFST